MFLGYAANNMYLLLYLLSSPTHLNIIKISQLMPRRQTPGFLTVNFTTYYNDTLPDHFHDAPLITYVCKLTNIECCLLLKS